MTDVKYEESDDIDVMVSNCSQNNHGHLNQNLVYQGYTTSTENSISTTTTKSCQSSKSLELEAKGGIPIVAEIGQKIGFDVGLSSTSSLERRTTTTTTYEMPGQTIIIPPKYRSRVYVSFKKIKGTATLKLLF